MQQEFILYRYRILELALYCLAAALNQICWISLLPIAGVLQNAYGVTNTEISAVSLVYMAIFVIAVFPANILLDKGGLKIGVLVGVVLTGIGMWIKCLINYSPIYVLLG